MSEKQSEQDKLKEKSKYPEYNMSPEAVKEWHSKAGKACQEKMKEDPTIRQKQIETLKNTYATTNLKEKRRDSANKQHQQRQQHELKNSVQHELEKLRQRLRKRSNNSCEMCGIKEEELIKNGKHGLLLHHLTYDKLVPDDDEAQLLCTSCHSKIDRKEGEELRQKKVCEQVGLLLNSIGIDASDVNFKETPRRMASWLIEFTLLDEQLNIELEQFASSIFPCKGNSMITCKDIKTYALCPHHLLPVTYKVSIAYIPEGYAIGISKLGRFAEVIAKQFQLQEEYVQRIADTLVKFLGTKSVMVIVSGRHMCMEMRGVKMDTDVITSAVRGAFKNEVTRNEALKLMRF